MRRRRNKGFYSEAALVKKLQEYDYNAVRVPVSNPSRSPLPDVVARKGQHVYAFEVKSTKYYAYFPRKQIDKLFRFLDEFIPTDRKEKHAILAGHFGRKWVFCKMTWEDWEGGTLPKKERLIKGQTGNFELNKSQ